MKLTADTNVLVRAVVDDDDPQCVIARQELTAADIVVVPTVVLCEMVWVLRRVYGFSQDAITDTVAAILGNADIVVDRPVAEAGLWSLKAGGDFADGVIAFEGRRLGGDIFVTFDRQAARLIKEQGGATRLLG